MTKGEKRLVIDALRTAYQQWSLCASGSGNPDLSDAENERSSALLKQKAEAAGALYMRLGGDPC